jgi:hypothetical protein
MSIPEVNGVQRTVFLHVGAPKTGTSFLQDALWANRDRLAEHGLLYPLEDSGEHFAVTMDLRQMEWGGERDPAWDGAWERVAERIRSSSLPRAVVSNELMAGASVAQVRGAVESLPESDVHVLYTARDLARQLPSDWQEQVKHTHTVPYKRFVDDLVTLGIDAPAPFGEMFWGLHDPLRVLPQWAEVVGPDHVHIITIPPRGGPRDLLVQRFARALGVEASLLRSDGANLNRSLGVVEAELLRRLNDRGRLPERLTWMYAGLVRLELAEWILGRRPGQRAIVLPEEYREWATARSQQFVDGLRSAGYDVIGDLDDLMPRYRGDDASGSPEHVSDAELLNTALETISDLLLRLGVVQNPPPEE